MRLAAKLGLVLLPLFGIVAISLLLWVTHETRKLSRESFVSQARSNAAFLKSARLSPTAPLAEHLSRILGLEVAAIVTPDQKENVFQTFDGIEEISVAVDGTGGLRFRRPSPTLAELLKRPNLGLLVLFALAVAASFGLLLHRQVTAPLQKLTNALARMEDTDFKHFPENDRHDEIGELARALQCSRQDAVQERALRTQAERLALLGRMATGLAHEIQNPVAAIQMHAELFRARPSLAASDLRTLDTILGEAARIEGLVNQWMFVARPHPPETSLMNLGELVEKIVQILTPLATHSRVVVKSECASNALVRGDARRLHQAISNLITNAIQAMPAGGSVTISLCERPNSYLLEIHDTGSGFSPTALLRGGELFFSEREGGMGIGLNLAREVVEAHGGSLKISNPPTGGAKVQIHMNRL